MGLKIRPKTDDWAAVDTEFIADTTFIDHISVVCNCPRVNERL